MPQTAYALLGLLTFRGEVTGYELKQLADRTLRFFWVSPAMSQVYSELARLARAGLVEERVEAGPDGRAARGKRYRISAAGREALEAWLAEEEVAFPVIKHGPVMRLFFGHLAGQGRVGAVLARYGDELGARVRELEEIRSGLGDDPAFRYPALVAEWGRRYYEEEVVAVREVMAALDRDRAPRDPPAAAGPGAPMPRGGEAPSPPGT